MADFVPFANSLQRSAASRPAVAVPEMIRWLGARVVDPNGRSVGKLEGLYVDRETDEPCWLLVTLGRFGTSSVIVPARGAQLLRSQVHITAGAETVRTAPRVSMSMSPLVAAEDRSLARHYRELDRLRDIAQKYDHMTTSRPITNFRSEASAAEPDFTDQPNAA